MTKYDDLIEYLLRVGDSAVVKGQRLCEWCGNAPALEEEMALMNVGLDLIGQARNWLDYAAELIDDGRDADQLAYCRDERAYRNLLLVEQPNGDFAVTMAKQFFYDAWQYHMLQGLVESSDERVAAIAAKALKEVTYHLRRSSEWVQRLGDGTEESHQRMVAGVEEVWRFTCELTVGDEVEQRLAEAGVIPAPEAIAEAWKATVSEVLTAATLTVPEEARSFYLNGRNGVHSEHLGILLAEMQFLQRAYPNATW
ncbi:MAG: phenylacetate-CoA oxygenase subunit PaaI [Oceanospirillaceae bacterium]|nr:phenylacetate-CoA oxygenase subunit PaaI [Oceanospirillaceae bacterium]|tara:strand:- start:1198 stop:1959 length:762 start_codon:yes stop_codon:yes gene_type:complete